MIAFVRVVDGVNRKTDGVVAMASATRFDVEEIGVMSPSRTPIEGLEAGEVGYIITGLKDVSELKVGDTLTTPANRAPSRCRATGTSSRWCSRACSRPTASSTPTCATRWRS